MRKREIAALLEEKVNEVFALVQEQEGVKDGDIDPANAQALEELMEKTAALIQNVVMCQKYGR